MTIKNTKLGGTDWIDGDILYAADLNDTVDAVGFVPVGAILPWAKSLTGVPSLLSDVFVECNGQTLSDADSPLNGQTIPDLNGDNRFLRGNVTSGDEGGSETKNISHQHTMELEGSGPSGRITGGNTASDYYNTTTNAAGSSTQDIMPPYHNVVWIMRVK